MVLCLLGAGAWCFCLALLISAWAKLFPSIVLPVPYLESVNCWFYRVFHVFELKCSARDGWVLCFPQRRIESRVIVVMVAFGSSKFGD